MISGKWIIGPFILFMLVFMGVFYYVSKNSKGRDHNREEQRRELAKQICLEKMQEYILTMKDKHQPVLIEKLQELSDNFEFYYIPENYPDMRKPLFITTDEVMIQLKTFSGELLPKSTSLGYYVMYGGEFKIKDVPTEKVKTFFNLIPAGEYGTKIDPTILEKSEGKVFLLKKKLAK
jgi:hypothetical protein